jgi:inorganic pyrophosphatase
MTRFVAALYKAYEQTDSSLFEINPVLKTSDDKIIAVAATDPGVNHYNNIEELPKHFFDELRHFFEEYKKLENKAVKVEEFGDKTMALKVIENAIAYYKQEFGKK